MQFVRLTQQAGGQARQQAHNCVHRLRDSSDIEHYNTCVVHTTGMRC
jgi:hypothetical protein